MSLDFEDISVITITKIDKSSYNLVKTLKSFSETVSGGYKEYIVVYAGKSDLDLQGELKDINIRNLRFIHSEVSNWSYQRNIGVKNSSGNLILFLDDGMRFQEGWFEELVDVFRNYENCGVVCGVVLPDQTKSIWGRCQGILNHPGGGYSLLKENIYEIQFFHTGICLGKKELFEIMFDENLKYGCEDMDISVRIKKNFPDVKFLLNPKAISFHHTRDEISKIWRWMVRYGKGRVDIYRKHGLKMSEFFVHKFFLFLFFAFTSSFVFSHFSFLIFLVFFYLFYLFKLSKYRKYSDLRTFLFLPLVFWVMNIAFDFGRISRILSYWRDSFKKPF